MVTLTLPLRRSKDPKRKNVREYDIAEAGLDIPPEAVKIKSVSVDEDSAVIELDELEIIKHLLDRIRRIEARLP
jgi:hypothetical protein